MALEKVSDYITESRGLMQDEVAPYRYSDASIVGALNIAIGDAYRVRPDMWLNYYDATLPSYSAGSPSATRLGTDHLRPCRSNRPHAPRLLSPRQQATPRGHGRDPANRRAPSAARHHQIRPRNRGQDQVARCGPSPEVLKSHFRRLLIYLKLKSKEAIETAVCTQRCIAF